MAGEQIGVGPLELSKLQRGSNGLANFGDDPDLSTAPQGLVLANVTRQFCGKVISPTMTADREFTLPDESLSPGAKPVVVPLSAAAFRGVSGTWTLTESAGQDFMRRTASGGSSDSLVAPITQEVQALALKGYELTGIQAVWGITVVPLTNIVVFLLTSKFNANGVAPSFTTLGGPGIGQANADYDANNNTNGKRASVGFHTADIVPSGGALGYMPSGSVYKVRVDVDGTAGPTGVLDFYGALLTMTKAFD